jgi:ubiquinone/menaquinone biosynthesis C-methylase UbiE
MSARGESANLGIYSAPEVVAHYADLGYLTACEQLLFETYLHPGMNILDLGVGGGRTTPYLSAIASRYVGLDYSDGMIRICRSKFPQLQFEIADASDLSRCEDASFDAVVFSFNGLDCLAPDGKRENCLRECHRVLKPGGVFIFSSHNPRSLFLDWQWDRDRLRRLAYRVAKGGVLFQLTLAALTSLRLMIGIARSFAKAIPRAFRRLPTATFWRGQGYILDPTHGGLLMHCAVPASVVAELIRFDFKLLQVLPEDYPRKSCQCSTRWYYYAFSKD